MDYDNIEVIIRRYFDDLKRKRESSDNPEGDANRVVSRGRRRRRVICTPAVPFRPAVPEIPYRPGVPEIPYSPGVPEQPYTAAVPEQPYVAAVPEQPYIPAVPETLYSPAMPALKDWWRNPSMPEWLAEDALWENGGPAQLDVWSNTLPQFPDQTGAFSSPPRAVLTPGNWGIAYDVFQFAWRRRGHGFTASVGNDQDIYSWVLATQDVTLDSRLLADDWSFIDPVTGARMSQFILRREYFVIKHISPATTSWTDDSGVEHQWGEIFLTSFAGPWARTTSASTDIWGTYHFTTGFPSVSDVLSIWNNTSSNDPAGISTWVQSSPLWPTRNHFFSYAWEWTFKSSKFLPKFGIPDIETYTDIDISNISSMNPGWVKSMIHQSASTWSDSDVTTFLIWRRDMASKINDYYVTPEVQAAPAEPEIPYIAGSPEIPYSPAVPEQPYAAAIPEQPYVAAVPEQPYIPAVPEQPYIAPICTPV